MKDHNYTTELEWSGSTGQGYRAYDRAHTVTMGEAGTLALSADHAFRGDPSRPNPELLLLAAASSCQLLSFLAVAARTQLDVVGYRDSAHGVMPGDSSPMRITEITLDITVAVRGADEPTVRGLLEEAHRQCYIANSLAAPVNIVATVERVT